MGERHHHMQTRQLQTRTNKKRSRGQSHVNNAHACIRNILATTTTPCSLCAALATMHVTAASGVGLRAWKHDDPTGARPARVRRSVDLWACGQERHSPRVRAQTSDERGHRLGQRLQGLGHGRDGRLDVPQLVLQSGWQRQVHGRQHILFSGWFISTQRQTREHKDKVKEFFHIDLIPQASQR